MHRNIFHNELVLRLKKSYYITTVIVIIRFILLIIWIIAHISDPLMLSVLQLSPKQLFNVHMLCYEMVE